MTDMTNREKRFQSTLPVRGATPILPRGAPGQLSISIHAPREGSDGGPDQGPSHAPISIHAPREGSDGPSRRDGALRRSNFNPRSP